MSVAVHEGPLEERYELIEGGQIGIGAHGRVYLANRLIDNETVIIKQIPTQHLDANGKAGALAEAQILSQFDHLNIIKIFEAIQDEGYLNICMENAPCGDLGHVVLKRSEEKKPFSEDEVMFYFVQILLALFHVHSKNILHRDIKTQNVFISDGSILKLGDFGISKLLSTNSELASTVVGTPYYLSPEICEDRPYSRKSDVWALGCLLYELCTLRRAFNGQSLPGLVMCILKAKYPPLSTRYSSKLRELVDSMLKLNPKERPSVDTLLRSAYVRPHVERYAQHVMAMSPLESPPDLGGPSLNPSGVVSLGQGQGQGQGGSIASKRETPSSTPIKAGPLLLVVGKKMSGSLIDPSSALAPATDSELEEVERMIEKGGVEGGGEGEGEEGGSPQRVKLLGTTWVNKQNQALQELQDALEKHDNSPVHYAKKSGGGAGPDNGSSPDGSSPLPKNTPSAPGPPIPQSPAAAAVAAPKAPVAVKPSPAAAPSPSPSGGKKNSQVWDAKRHMFVNSEAAVKAKTAEREREVARMAQEKQREEERRLKKAAETKEQIKTREEEKRKLQEDISSHMAAHKQQIKAVKPRINREELLKAGREFAARLQGGGVEEGGGGFSTSIMIERQSVAKQDPSSASTSSQPQAPAPRGSKPPLAKPSPAPTSTSTPAKDKEPPPLPPRKAKNGSGRKSDGGSFPEFQIFAPSGSSSNTPNKEKASEARASSRTSEPSPPPPPWKAKKGPDANHPASGFPNVEIYAPEYRPPRQSAAPKRSGDELINVLSVIQDVLSAEDGGGEEEGEGNGVTPLKNKGDRGGDHSDDSSSSPGLHLPPEREEPPPHPSPPTYSSPLSSNPKDKDKSSPHPHLSPGDHAALRAETLRMELEYALTSDVFTRAYRYLRSIQDEEGEGEGEFEEARQAQHQRELESILGSKLNLARIIHKVIMLEDAVFR